MKVKFIEDDKEFGIKAGDIFEATPHDFEPDCKVNLVKRLSDNFDPECSAYNHQVERWSDKKQIWVDILCTCCS